MRTLEQIREDINTVGKVTRADILEVLNLYADKDKEQENIGSFLDSLAEGVLSLGGKEKILDDLQSYPVDYER